MPSEQQIQQHIRIACSTGATRLFRNNTGTLRDQHGRPVSFGLCKGSADLIGYRSITITPEMVGQQVAVFPVLRSRPLPAGSALSSSSGWKQSKQQAASLVWQGQCEDALRIMTAQG
jgi:hypothetical protein